MKLRKPVVAAVAALLCSAYVVIVDPKAASADNVPEFGFASLTTLASTTTDDFNAYAAQVKNVGASWVRLVVAWNNVEPNQGQFNWSTVDPAVLAARANGTKMLLLLTGPAPAWAQGLLGNPLNGAATPSDPATFGQFAAATANRYKEYASTWEIWNEPNDPTFFQSPNVPSYIQLLKSAYQSIHAIQPGAVVVSGGVSSTPAAPISETSFVDQLYSNGARPYLDGIGMHPYTIPYGISDDPRHVWNDLATARTTMTNYGDSAKKIWVTEWGIPTGTSESSSTEAQQSARLIEALKTAAATPYLAPFFLFTVRDLSTDATNLHANFGVYRSDGTPKAAAFAIQQYATGTAPPTSTTTTTAPTTTPTTAPTSPPTTTTRPSTSAPGTNLPNMMSILGGMFDVPVPAG